jgi:hypothetical protein
MPVVLLLIAVPVLALVLWLAGQLAPVGERDVAWLAGTAHLEPAEAEVYRRYLTRHRYHRLAGGAFGAAFAVVVGIRWYGSVGIGSVQSTPAADLLFCTVAGVLAGALSAETFRLRTPASGAAASLVPHAAPARPDLVRNARLVTGATVLTGVVAVLGGWGGGALAVAVGGLVVAAVAEACRRSITERQRPVLSPAADRVDRRLRGFASGSIAYLELAAAVLTLMWTTSAAVAPAGTSTDLEQVVDAVRAVVGLGGLVLAVVLLRRAAPRPRRGAP